MSKRDKIRNQEVQIKMLNSFIISHIVLTHVSHLHIRMASSIAEVVIFQTNEFETHYNHNPASF